MHSSQTPAPSATAATTSSAMSSRAAQGRREELVNEMIDRAL
jgi:hypothetical protein